MSVTRRGWIKWGTGSVLSGGLLTACGGGEEASEAPAPEVVEAGLSEVKSLPAPLEFNAQLASDVLPALIEARVRFGNTPMAGAKVTVYDLNGAVLAQGVTDDDGFFASPQQARKLMFAAAETVRGPLYGYLYSPSIDGAHAINLNLYQSLAANMAEQVGELEYNVINFLLQEYFDINYVESIQSIDVDSPYFSQQLLADAIIASGQRSEDFLKALAAKVLATRQDGLTAPALDYRPVQQVPRTSAALRLSNAVSVSAIQALPSIDDVTKYKVIEFALTQAEGIINGLVKFPYSDKIVAFFFSKLKGELKPQAPDPLAEVKQKLDVITSRLDDITDLLKNQRIESFWTKFVDVWEKSSTRRKAFNDAIDAASARVALRDALYLINLSKSDIESMNDWFFGGGEVKEEQCYLYLYSKYLEDQPFFTSDMQIKLNDQVAAFLMRQTAMVGFSIAMVTQDANQRGLSEADAKAEVASLSKSLEETKDLVRKYRESLHDIPSRIFIHKQSNTIWVGLCNSVARPTDFLESRNHTSRFFHFGVNWPSTGTNTGVDNQKYMLYDKESNPNGVPQEVIDFANWRLPSKGELEKAFINDAKKLNGGSSIEAFAQKRMIPNGTPFKQFDYLDKKLHAQYATITTRYFNDNRTDSFLSRGYCWMSEFINLNNYKIEKDGLPAVYGSSQRSSFYILAYFPTAVKSADQLKKYYPINVYAAFREKAPKV